MLTKTKELLVDFREQLLAVPPITIDGAIFNEYMYRYVVIIFYNKLENHSIVLDIYEKVPLWNMLLTKADEHWY